MEITNESHRIKFKKFDGKEFNLWKSKVENGLMFLGIDSYLTVKAETTEAAKVLSEKKALAFLKESLSDNLFRKYNQATPKELWDQLKTDYATIDAQLLFVKRNKFLFCKKNRNESMSDYLNRLTSLKQELTEAGNQVSDSNFILTIMNGTHEDYGDFVSAITGKTTIDKLAANTLMTQLIQEDDLRQSMSQREAKGNNYSDRRVYFSKNELQARITNKYPKRTQYSIKNRKCYNCGIPGHYANDCRKMKSVAVVKQPLNKEKEYVCIENNRSKQRVCTVSEVNFTSGELDERSKWFLDSGASTHVCNSYSMFDQITTEKSSITVGDDREVAVTGRGTIKLKVKANEKTNILTLHDVAFVPDLGVNLVSAGRLECQGLKIVTENGMSEISLKNDLIACAVRSNENPYLYEIKILSNDSVFVTRSNNTKDWSVWHQRLGHLSGDNMKKLVSSDIKSTPLNEEFCENCHLCKAKKLPHKHKLQNDINEERQNGLRKGVIHSDLMGPMKTTSMSGCRYVLTYICSQTEYSYVYLLKSKSEQEKYFKVFKAFYEKQHETKIKQLRSDNGLEYFSNNFQSYLQNEGIKHLTSVAYVPQSNGKAERLNRTLLEKARTMLLTAGLETYMRGAAILTANYLRNRSPCRSINYKTPYEVTHEKLPAISHLKIFGCNAYPLNLNEKT